jgi:hypothetical protein
MHAMLVVNIAVILGYLMHHWISNATTIKLDASKNPLGKSVNG